MGRCNSAKRIVFGYCCYAVIQFQATESLNLWRVMGNPLKPWDGLSMETGPTLTPVTPGGRHAKFVTYYQYDHP
jgi:hypothetical protein